MKRYSHTKGEEGVILVVALALTLIFSLLTLAVVTTLLQENRVESDLYIGERSYYISEAGLERAIWESASGGQAPLEEVPDSTLYADSLMGGDYSVMAAVGDLLGRDQWPNFRYGYEGSGVNLTENQLKPPLFMGWKHRVTPAVNYFYDGGGGYLMTENLFTIVKVIGEDSYAYFSYKDRGNRLYVHSMNALTGKGLWEREIARGTRLSAMASLVGEPRIFISYQDIRGGQAHLICLNSFSGETIWDREIFRDIEETLPLMGYGSAPVLYDPDPSVINEEDILFIVALHERFPNHLYLLSYRVMDGSLRWVEELPMEGYNYVRYGWDPHSFGAPTLWVDEMGRVTLYTYYTVSDHWNSQGANTARALLYAYWDNGNEATLKWGYTPPRNPASWESWFEGAVAPINKNGTVYLAYEEAPVPQDGDRNWWYRDLNSGFMTAVDDSGTFGSHRWTFSIHEDALSQSINPGWNAYDIDIEGEPSKVSDTYVYFLLNVDLPISTEDYKEWNCIFLLDRSTGSLVQYQLVPATYRADAFNASCALANWVLYWASHFRDDVPWNGRNRNYYRNERHDRSTLYVLDAQTLGILQTIDLGPSDLLTIAPTVANTALYVGVYDQSTWTQTMYALSSELWLLSEGRFRHGLRRTAVQLDRGEVVYWREE